MGDERGKRKRIAVSLMAVLVLFGIAFPALVRAAGYSISDQSSCDAFRTAIGATGSSTSTACYINSGTLGASDTLTVGNFILRPQYASNPDVLVFTNQGSVTVNNNPGDWSLYVAGKVDNQATLNINGTSVNFSTLNNSGTMVLDASLTNYGTINNTGTIQKTCSGSLTNSGTFTGNAVEDLCLLTMTATSSATSTATNTATDTATSTTTNTATNTPTDTATSTTTNTPTDTPTSTNTNTPTNTPIYSSTPTSTSTAVPTNTLTSTPTITPTTTSTPCIVAAPVLLSPADGAGVKGTTVHLDWQDDVCATKYKARVKENSKTGKVVARKGNLKVSEYDVVVSLTRANVYFWRVKACNKMGCSVWSGYWSFHARPEASANEPTRWVRDDWMFTKDTQVALR